MFLKLIFKPVQVCCEICSSVSRCGGIGQDESEVILFEDVVGWMPPNFLPRCGSGVWVCVQEVMVALDRVVGGLELFQVIVPQAD